MKKVTEITNAKEVTDASQRKAETRITEAEREREREREREIIEVRQATREARHSMRKR